MREALSARLDGEALPAGVDDVRLGVHVLSCPGCREWLFRAEALGSRWRLGPAPVVPDLTGWVLDAVAPVRRRDRGRAWRMAARAALVLVAAAELAVTAPVLVLGHDREAPLHVAHEMGSFGLAMAVGFLAATFRPRLAAGVAWLVTAAAGSLAVTAVLDVVRGLTTWSDETPHLVVIGGAALLWVLCRLEPSGADGLPDTEPVDGGFAADHARYPLRLLYRSRVTPRPILARQDRKAS